MHGANLKAGTGKSSPEDEILGERLETDAGFDASVLVDDGPSEEPAEARPSGIDALLDALPDSATAGPDRPPRPQPPATVGPIGQPLVPPMPDPSVQDEPLHRRRDDDAPADNTTADDLSADERAVDVVEALVARTAEARATARDEADLRPEPEVPLVAERPVVTEAGDTLPQGVVADRRTPRSPRVDVESIATPTLVADALTQAIDAVELAVALVERASGTVLWSSPGWVDRFGHRELLARHLPSSTELGELPIPGPDESWRRTRTVTMADGSEDLVELVMAGATSEEGIDYATVVALEAVGGRAVITDRSEVIGVVDGAVAEADEGAVAVLYVDLDRFKVVHDLVGNVEARRLLDLVNRRISATVRGSDLVFRMPSDEFIIVACEVEDADGVEALAERIRVGVATLADVGNDMALTASVGIAIADGKQTGDELVAAAETAVYLAKGRGRNRIALHDEELRSRTQRLMVVERQLRRAIERRDVRFAYQPVVEVGTGRVVGAEALLRLGGDVGLSAVEVVAAAEQSGLMGVLGALVLEGVEEQLGQVLRSPNRDQLVMINLSAAQLADESLLSALSDLIDDDSIPAGRLAVEVPESVLREHGDAVRLLATSVRKRFEIGVDGFGTSADSFDLVDGVPVNYLKLHRSITAAIGTDEGERARLEMIIERARSESLGVVALGVERTDQVRALRSVGCRMAQGFLYAGAVSAEELIQLMVSGFPETAEASR